MNPIDAYHLPGLGEDDVRRWEIREYDGGAVRLRIPILVPATLERMLGRLREARARHLADTPVLEVVRALDRTAALLMQPDHPVRRLAETALPAVTGYSPAMIRLVLDRMTPDWREPALRGLLAAELGDPGVLDEFRVRPGGRGAGEAMPRETAPGDMVPGGTVPGGAMPGGAVPGAGSVPQVRVRAFGPELAFHIFAGNVPGVAVTSLVRSLLVKAATLGKTAAGEPLLPALFARTLAQVSPTLGECIAVTYWPGGEAALEEAALRAADTVVVYGGGETVQAVRSRVPPGTRLVEHGPRFSLAVVARGELQGGEGGREGGAARRAAAGVARAAAVFDQQGCVSPHVVFVERGGEVTPEEFAGLVAEEMERVESELPRGRLSAAEAATIQQVRGAAEFRAIAGREVRVLASAGTEYTVIYDDEPGFTASCLNRVLRVTPLDDLDDLVRHLEPFGAFLQTVGVAASAERRAELAEQLGRAGVSRVTTLEAMPWPPPAWHHDGQEPLRELLRWVDLEG